MCITIWQARQAKGAATQVEAMRRRIMESSKHGELSSLNSTLKSAVRAMSKYGSGASKDTRRGASPDNDADNVRAVTSEMSKLRDHLIEKLGDDIDSIINDLHTLLDSFGAASKDEQRALHGCNIYRALERFQGDLKTLLDTNVYGQSHRPRAYAL